MRSEEFIDLLKEIMEIEDRDIRLETNLKEMSEYDSLVVLEIVALADENFGKHLAAKQITAVTTVKSLMEAIGMEHFE